MPSTDDAFATYVSAGMMRKTMIWRFEAVQRSVELLLKSQHNFSKDATEGTLLKDWP